MYKPSEYARSYRLTELDKDIKEIKESKENSAYTLGVAQSVLNRSRTFLEMTIEELEHCEKRLEFLDKIYSDGVDLLFEEKDKIVELFEKAGLEDAEGHIVDRLEDFNEDRLDKCADDIANEYFNMEYYEIEKSLKEGGFIYRVQNELSHLSKKEMLEFIYDRNSIAEAFGLEDVNDMLNAFTKIGETSQKIIINGMYHTYYWLVVNRLPEKDDFDKLKEELSFSHGECEVGYGKLEDSLYIIGRKDAWYVDCDFHPEKEALNKNKGAR